MTKSIELCYEQIDQIVIDELKEALEMNIQYSSYDGEDIEDPDHELVAALKTVLGYFMNPTECEEYLRDIALQEMTNFNQAHKLYD